MLLKSLFHPNRLMSVFVVLTISAEVSARGFAQSNDEKEIRAADAAWSQAAQDKDLGKSVSFYADNASVFPFNSPIASGREQIHQLWSHRMSLPGFAPSFRPTRIEVSKSRDMAYETGTFDLKLNGSQGNPGSTPGKYGVVWKKGPTHEWKAVADIFNTDK